MTTSRITHPAPDTYATPAGETYDSPIQALTAAGSTRPYEDFEEARLDGTLGDPDEVATDGDVYRMERYGTTTATTCSAEHIVEDHATPDAASRDLADTAADFGVGL